MTKKHLSTRQDQQKQSRRNNLLYENLNYNGTFLQSTEIQITTYDEANCQTEIVKDAKSCSVQAGKVTWVQVRGLANPEMVSAVCRQFGLTIPVIQDILNVQHIAKIEETGGLLFAVLNAYLAEKELVRVHKSIILGPGFVLSFEDGAEQSFNPVQKAILENVGQVRKHHADYLFNLLISVVVDSYFDVLEQQQEDLSDMEDALMEFNATHQESGRQIQLFRHDFMRLKKAISPFKESFSRMFLMDSILIEKATTLYFRDTYDHLQQIMLMLEANREMIASLVDLYVANNDLRTNNVMKQLTVVATIFIPLTFLVGVWGMNFKIMPELNMQFGYFYAWIVIVVIGLGLYFWFRRKNIL